MFLFVNEETGEEFYTDTLEMAKCSPFDPTDAINFLRLAAKE